jgi:hypothetical protein
MVLLERAIMALTDAEKQHRRRARLKQQGFVHVQGWVSPHQAAAIKAIMRSLPTIYQPEIDEQEASARSAGGDMSSSTAPTMAHPASGPITEAVTSHPPGVTPEPPGKPAKVRRPSARTIRKWKDQAADRAPHGLSAVLEHFQRVSGEGDFGYAHIPLLLSENGYKLACCAEIKRLLGEGLSWLKIAKVFNARALPRPRPDKGKWTGPKVKALMDR